MEVDQLDDYRQRMVDAIDEAVKRRRTEAPVRPERSAPVPTGQEPRKEVEEGEVKSRSRSRGRGVQQG